MTPRNLAALAVGILTAAPSVAQADCTNTSNVVITDCIAVTVSDPSVLVKDDELVLLVEPTEVVSGTMPTACGTGPWQVPAHDNVLTTAPVLSVVLFSKAATPPQELTLYLDSGASTCLLRAVALP